GGHRRHRSTPSWPPLLCDLVLTQAHAALPVTHNRIATTAPHRTVIANVVVQICCPPGDVPDQRDDC
ncbi:hypothetical protein, partial [Mycobacterium avium]